MNSREQYIISLIKTRIKKKNSQAEVILFGSHARGQSHADSDWDILILLNIPHVTHQIEKEFREELFEVELEIGEPISTFVYSKQDWESRHSITPLYKSIKKEGVLIE